MVRLTYGCSRCQYRGTRKSNAQRHITDVHHGAADLLLFPMIQTWPTRGNYPNYYDDITFPLYTPLASVPPVLNASSKMNKTGDDFLTSFVNQTNDWVKVSENLNKISGNMAKSGSPQFTHGYYWPANAAQLITSAKNLQTETLLKAGARAASPKPNDSDVLGTKCYICGKCFLPEFVPFSLSSDPSARGGLPSHHCERAEPLIKDVDMQRQALETAYRNMADSMAEKFNELSDGVNYLIALEANPLQSFPAELNLVKFGSLSTSNITNNYLFRAINEGIALTDAELHDFVHRTHATYGLFEFDYDGNNKFYYFMFLDPPRRTAPKTEEATYATSQVPLGQLMDYLS